ncbi:Hypothetical predicted protein [Olea europaea subsp. europaea]|uniref:Uncharacterized protein n=1 Tax=Olea europaea subsp. europaea TaxID=158383 RepID=A0A8S0QKA7_OLEEU|nr:Hypothetical predicted protein [Olea europaea subsp. europaea]
MDPKRDTWVPYTQCLSVVVAARLLVNYRSSATRLTQSCCWSSHLGKYLLGNSHPIVPYEATCKFDSKGRQPIDQNEKSHHQFEERIYQDNLEFISEVLTREEEIFCLPPALPILSPDPVETSRTGSNNHNEAACIMSSTMSHMEIKSSKQK